MADIIKPFNVADIDNVLVDLYTCPPGTVALCLGLILCNKNAVNPIEVDVKFFDASSTVETFILFSAPIAVGQSLFVIGDPLRQALEAGDKIRARAVLGINVLDVTGSVMEQAV